MPVVEFLLEPPAPQVSNVVCVCACTALIAMSIAPIKQGTALSSLGNGTNLFGIATNASTTALHALGAAPGTLGAALITLGTALTNLGTAPVSGGTALIAMDSAPNNGSVVKPSKKKFFRKKFFTR